MSVTPSLPKLLNMKSVGRVNGILTS